MIASWGQLKDRLFCTLGDDPFWGRYMREVEEQEGARMSVHLAVFKEPFLQLIIEGKKTVESRFSSVRCAPYRRVKSGDVLLLKRSSGPISGICIVEHVWTYELDPESWVEVKQFADALCATDPTFWAERETASYATLMRVRRVKKLPALPFKKRDRRGWVVLRDGSEIPKIA